MERSFDVQPPQTILFLEDDPDFAAADAMRDAGLDVLSASHPWDAFRHLDSDRRIDPFLTDIRMPEGMPHGFAMARMARYRRAKLKLLFVTAYREMAEADNDRSAQVLFKPIHPERLAQAVRLALAEGGLPS